MQTKAPTYGKFTELLMMFLCRALPHLRSDEYQLEVEHEVMLLLNWVKPHQDSTPSFDCRKAVLDELACKIARFNQSTRQEFENAGSKGLGFPETRQNTVR